MMNLDIRQIRTDGGTQPRAGLDEATVADYAESVKRGETFPPVVIYFDDTNYWLADGFHRLEAHRVAKKRSIKAEIRLGTIRDAVLHSVGANATHGLRRSNEDKRRAIEMLLSDSEWASWSDREIAKRCKVSHPFVAKIREEMGIHTGNISSMERTFIHHKTGEQTVMNVPRPIIDQVREHLLKQYPNTDYATLASHARALHRQGFADVARALGKDDPMTLGVVRHALTSLAQDWQAQIPQPEAAVKQATMPALLKLIDSINALTPAGCETVSKWCQGISVRSDAQETAPVWNALEKLLCDLRQN
jgi:hypothetical protein